jgi:hypothetical protein
MDDLCSDVLRGSGRYLAFSLQSILGDGHILDFSSSCIHVTSHLHAFLLTITELNV